MDFLTHLCIAGKLKRIVRKELDVKLNTFSFLLGNVKPDISSKYVNIPHFKKDSNDFVRNEIKSILYCRVYQGKRCTHDFSERLGIITHYISDFFCYAHSGHFTGSMAEHYLYEISMMLKNIRNPGNLACSCSRSHIAENGNLNSIFNYIDTLNDEYLSAFTGQEADSIKSHPEESRNKESHKELHAKESRFMETDMAYTMKACVFLCLSVISECLASEESISDLAYDYDMEHNWDTLT